MLSLLNLAEFLMLSSGPLILSTLENYASSPLHYHSRLLSVFLHLKAGTISRLRHLHSIFNGMESLSEFYRASNTAKYEDVEDDDDHERKQEEK